MDRNKLLTGQPEHDKAVTNVHLAMGEIEAGCIPTLTVSDIDVTNVEFDVVLGDLTKVRCRVFKPLFANSDPSLRFEARFMGRTDADSPHWYGISDVYFSEQRDMARKLLEQASPGFRFLLQDALDVLVKAPFPNGRIAPANKS